MKQYLTAEEIAKLAEEKDGMANIRAINALYRKQDESHLYPIHNEFNVTERAIRKAREIARANGAFYGYEYALTLENTISNIVNRSY